MKKLLSVFLAVTLLACAVIVPANAAGSVTPIGPEGAGINWYYDVESATMTMTGAGEIPDYALGEDVEDLRPWRAYVDVIEKIVLSDEITRIGDNAFSGISTLCEVELPDALETIGDGAFKGTALTDLALPEGVVSVESYAFADVSSLASVTFPTTLTAIGDGAFANCVSIKSVLLPGGITDIANETFMGCEALVSVILPGQLASIGDYAFGDCAALAAVMIPDSVETVGDGAFAGTAISELRLPASLRALGDGVFAESALSRIIVPDSAYGFTGATFAMANALESIVISAEHPVYTVADDAIYTSDMTEIVMYLGDGEQYIIPEGVTTVGRGAFMGCDGILAITLPDSVADIEDYAFCGTNILEMSLPATVATVGVKAFADTEKLVVLVIPGMETAVDEDAFEGSTATVFAQEGSAVHTALVEAEDEARFVKVDNDLGFIDVTTEKWSYEGIEYAVRAGLFNGTRQTLFSPDDSMTRAMLVSVLYRMDGQNPVEAENKFADVAEGRYYYDAVLWAAENGIVNGVSETEFAPDAPVTREQLAAIVHRYAAYLGIHEGGSVPVSDFVDAEEVSEYAVGDLEWAVGNGLIAGVNDYGVLRLDSKGGATRAQVATILYRFVTLPEGEDPETPADPEDPVDPETPVDPEEPAEPADPETPVDPEEPAQ